MKRKKIVLLLAFLLFVILVLVGIKWIDDKHTKEFDIDLTENNSYLKKVSFQGVNFMCPANWDVQKKVSATNEISCVDNNANTKRGVHFMWINVEIPPEVWIEEGLKDAESNLGSNKASVSSIKSSMFNTINSKSIDISYTDTDTDTKVYGKITSFNLKGNSCIVIMFNDSEIVNDADFYAIEKSFVVK